MRNEQEIFHQLHCWAESQDHIRAMVLTSSRANPNAFIDLFSDYDIELYVTELQSFVESDKWLAAFGPILICWPKKPTSFVENWITRLVIYEDGLRIDFQISTTESLAKFSQTDLPLSDLDNGYKILLDKDQRLTNPVPPTYTKFIIKRPTQAEYDSLVHDFWWDISYVAKSLWRDELFFAKYMLDSSIRFTCLQKIIEWFIGLNSGWTAIPNKNGRWFKRYLDSKTWTALESTFAGSGIEENWTALFSTIDLFRWLAADVGESLGYHYPAELDDRITAYLLKIKHLDRQAADFNA